MILVHYNMAEQTRGWWEILHINVAYYADYPSLAKHQAGGVCQWSINKGAHQVMETGQDFRGLEDGHGRNIDEQTMCPSKW
jgi:hypothetical protein